MLNTRLLSNEDSQLLTNFLMGHANTSLFMLSNIKHSQIDFTGKRFQGRYWGAFTGETLGAVLVQYWSGIVMAQGDTALVLDLWHQYRDQLKGIKGFVGRDDLCKALKNAFDSEPAERHYTLASTEWLYELNLSDLRKPALLSTSTIHCRLATEQDQDFLLPWMIDYNVEALEEPRTDLLIKEVTESLHHKINDEVMYVLFDGNTPLATTGFNAKTKPFVQVGGVWTPVHLRAKGYARSVVAASLFHAIELGFERSVLFTDGKNPAAQKVI